MKAVRPDDSDSRYRGGILSALMHLTLLGLLVWEAPIVMRTLQESPSTEQAEVETPKPETAKPETLKPETPKTETPEPETAKPETPKPEAPKTETPEPETAKLETPKPEAPKAETPEPEAAKPETPKPEAPKTETPKPETTIPETPKPEAPKTETPKPETAKSETPKPEASTPKTAKSETPAGQIVPVQIVIDLPKGRAPPADRDGDSEPVEGRPPASPPTPSAEPTQRPQEKRAVEKGTEARERFPTDAERVAALLRQNNLDVARVLATESPASADPNSVAQKRRRQIQTDTIKRAAELGYAHARMTLAGLYLRGEDVAKNPERARDLLLRATEQGHTPSALALAALAAEALGKPDSTPDDRQDLTTAYALLTVAAGRGDKAARQAQELIEPLMLPGEIAGSRADAQKWRRLLAPAPNPQEKGILTAADQGDADAVITLLAQGANADDRDGESRTPLINASWRGHLRAVRALIERGADIDLRDQDGKTALHWAAINGRSNIIGVLGPSGADPNAVDSEALTPLMRAAWNGHADSVQKLLDLGAMTAPRDLQGRTALELARLSGNGKVVELLSAARR